MSNAVHEKIEFPLCANFSPDDQTASPWLGIWLAFTSAQVLNLLRISSYPRRAI